MIALTAHCMQSDQDQCIAIGMDHFITKPIKRQMFYDTIALCVKTSVSQEDTMNGGHPLSVMTKCILDNPKPQLVNFEELLWRVDDNMDVIHKLIDLFLSTCPKTLTALDAAIQQGNKAQQLHLAHELKGISSNFSASEMTQLVSDLETEILTMSDQQLESHMKKLWQAFNHTADYLNSDKLVSVA